MEERILHKTVRISRAWYGRTEFWERFSDWVGGFLGRKRTNILYIEALDANGVLFNFITFGKIASSLSGFLLADANTWFNIDYIAINEIEDPYLMDRVSQEYFEGEELDADLYEPDQIPIYDGVLTGATQLIGRRRW